MYMYTLQYGASLYGRVVIAMKIKPGENLTKETFYRRKIPDLRYKTSCAMIFMQSGLHNLLLAQKFF